MYWQMKHVLVLPCDMKGHSPSHTMDFHCPHPVIQKNKNRDFTVA